MAIVTMPVSDVRKELNGLVDRLDQPVFVTTHGRVKAVLMDIDAYNDLLDRLEARDAADPEVQQALADAETAYQRGDTIPIEDVLKEYGLSSHPTPASKKTA